MMRLSFTSTATVLRQLSQNQRFQTPHNVSVSRTTTTITKSPPQTLFSLFRNLSTATSSKIHKVTTANFESVVLNAKQPIIVDCMATWCGPCKVIGPRLEEAVNKSSTVQLGVVDIDENPEVADQLSVTAVPTVVAYHKGKIVDKFVGAQAPEFIETFVKKLEELHNKA